MDDTARSIVRTSLANKVPGAGGMEKHMMNSMFRPSGFHAKKRPTRRQKHVNKYVKPGSKTQHKLANKLALLQGKQEHSTNLVQGFDLEKAPKYRHFLAIFRKWEKCLMRNALKTTKGQKAFVETLAMLEKLNSSDLEVNVAQLVADAADVDRCDHNNDGYDRYFVAKQAWREVWIGRSASLGTGRRGRCPKHSKMKVRSIGLGKAQTCTCHYSVCIVCRWGADLSMLEPYRSMIAPDTAATSIRQVRYLTDNIGIILYSCANVVEQLMHAEHTLQRICTDLTLLTESLQQLAEYRRIVVQVMGTGGPYKPVLDSVEKQCKLLIGRVVQLLAKARKHGGR